MTRYKRKFDCAVCGGTVYHDDQTNIRFCKCGQVKGQIPDDELSNNFAKIPQVIIEAPFGKPKNTWIDYSRVEHK